jgi:hypothetical protein
VHALGTTAAEYRETGEVQELIATLLTMVISESHRRPNLDIPEVAPAHTAGRHERAQDDKVVTKDFKDFSELGLV